MPPLRDAGMTTLHGKNGEGRIPVSLVTGFLGAGKTTLLRRALEGGLGGERLAVLVNEVGEIGIDGALLKRRGAGMVELTNGCLCCQIQGDLHDALVKMADTLQPDRVLIEASGVAEPGKVLGLLWEAEELVRRYRVEPTLCVVDAERFSLAVKELAYHVVCQVKSSDVVVLNKMDRASAAQARAAEREVGKLNPRALVVRAVRGDVDLERLLAVETGVAGISGAPLGTISRRTHREFQSESIRLDGVFEQEKVTRFLEGLPRGVFRAKGFVNLPRGCRLVNMVTGTVEWEAVPDGASEKTEMVFVGRGLNRTRLAAGLTRCRKGESNGKEER